MSPKRRWWLLALVSLIAVAAIGSWGCCTVTCCDTKPRNHLVLVPANQAEEEKIPDIVIRKSLHQEIVWKLPTGTSITKVAIRLAGKPAPFVLCQTSRDLCEISCTSGLCPSGPIDPNLPVPEKKPGPYYKYEFTRSGQASADPGIRIDP